MKKGMTIREFMNREEIGFMDKMKHHIVKNKSFYITVGGATVFFLFCWFDFASAAGQMDIDSKGESIYKRIVLGAGKWVVIFKGAFDIVQSATAGDLQSVKVKLIGYLLVFVTLLGLPWAFKEIEGLFS
jgi:hypothetical protein